MGEPKSESQKEVERARRTLRDVLSMKPEVDEVVDTLRRINQRNRFAERIEESMRRMT